MRKKHPKSDATGAALRPPRLLEGGRWAAFLALAGAAIVEAGLQIGVASALRTSLQASSATVTSALMLGGAGLALAGVSWTRQVASENFGHLYANAVRGFLARHAVRAAPERRRLGVLNVRMTSDLNALRLWADKGLCGGVANGFGLVGAFGAAYLAAGPAGMAAAAIGPVLALVAGTAAFPALRKAILQRRDARGALSAKTGDLALEARVITAFGLEGRSERRIARFGRRLAEASVAEARIVQALRALPGLALPLGVALLAGLSGGAGHSALGWAGILFALSLAAGAVSGLVQAFEAAIEQQIASAKLRSLAGEAIAPALALGEEPIRLPPGPGLRLEVDGVVLAAAGAWVEVPRDDAWRAALGRVIAGGAGISVDGKPAEAIDRRDWRRRVAICTPDVPLARGDLTQLLAIRTPANPQRVERALAVVGLRPDDARLAGVIDPAALDARLAAQLRLARALAARPRLVVIDDAWIASDAALVGRLRRFQDARALTVVVARVG